MIGTTIRPYRDGKDQDYDLDVLAILKRKKEVDLVIPSFITANELIVALNEAYQLNIDTSDITECYLQAENPITLLRGNKTVEEFGLRDGTVIYYAN